jgi:hypothetical protein
MKRDHREDASVVLLTWMRWCFAEGKGQGRDWRMAQQLSRGCFCPVSADRAAKRIWYGIDLHLRHTKLLIFHVGSAAIVCVYAELWRNVRAVQTTSLGVLLTTSA